MNIEEKIDMLLMGEDDSKKVVSAQQNMLNGLQKQLEHELTRQKTLKTPEDKAKGQKRIAEIHLSIAKVRKGMKK